MANILIIDDEAPIRLLLRDALEREGHQVLDAADGSEGVRLFKENPSDLVVTDIVMPNKEGLETIMELKKESPNVKIVAMSGGGKIAPDSYLQMAKGLGAVQSFSKPFGIKTFLSAVKEILG